MTKIKIEDFEDKKTTAGKPYTRFKTSEGWMSCFDGISIESLKKECGKIVDVDLKEKDGFKNIKKFLGSTNTGDEEVGEVKPESKSNARKEMYVSYAKDCFCGIVTRISQAKFDDFEESDVEKLMDLAIKVTKKAESAF